MYTIGYYIGGVLYAEETREGHFQHKTVCIEPGIDEFGYFFNIPIYGVQYAPSGTKLCIEYEPCEEPKGEATEFRQALANFTEAFFAALVDDVNKVVGVYAFLAGLAVGYTLCELGL